MTVVVSVSSFLLIRHHTPYSKPYPTAAANSLGPRPPPLAQRPDDARKTHASYIMLPKRLTASPDFFEGPQSRRKGPRPTLILARLLPTELHREFLIGVTKY